MEFKFKIENFDDTKIQTIFFKPWFFWSDYKIPWLIFFMHFMKQRLF